LPLYAYRCTQCGHRFEKIQHFGSKQELVCPKCQGVLERPLTAPAFKFKGKGWYVNEFFQRRHPRAGNPSDGRHPGSRANIHPGACRCHHHFHFHFHFHDQLAFLEPCQDGVPHLSFLRHGKAQPSIAARTDLPLRR
jgi:putative FmdB family regulatory protein